MTIREIFSKGKVANIHKLSDFGKCKICGKEIIIEDDEVGFCGVESDWNDYYADYDGYLDLDEELEVVAESDTEVEANSYYDDAQPNEAEYTAYELHNGRDICVVFCSEDCKNEYWQKSI